MNSNKLLLDRMRTEAIAKAKEIVSLNPLFLDTETTGLDDQAEIVEISVLDINGNVIFDTLVKPKKPIGSEASAINNIDNSMLENAPYFYEIMDDLKAIFKGRTVVIYNANYDTRLLHQSAKAWGKQWTDFNSLCAMLLYSWFVGEWRDDLSLRWHKLIDASERFGSDTYNAHRAKGDCLMTIDVVKGIANAEKE